MALTRQGLPLLRTTPTDENLCAKGAYVLIEPEGGRDVTLLATGSEVSLAVEAAKALEGEGIKAAVVSMPCWELFDAQERGYQEKVLGSASPRGGRGRSRVRLAEMAGSGRHLYRHARIRGFGARLRELYKHFGITPEAVAAAARGLIVKIK